MTRSKKIFAGFALVFLALLIYVSIDISRKTTFPGSKPQLRERIKESYLSDSVKSDTLGRSDP
jgi:hypothetical protein